ncbi:hypothetical protein HDC92_001381 [Pedobacter sp. AK017]|uniref:DUF4194 domain-containing protein n=1 Tax=Pedobacter sp. AK017 TaxID=2723073 RepID=UPI001606FE70|nr:DUF4194 domain-containing protein [Pedobacter sp. AK017]MBB5437707.1 hypothetical protein [Pedobacter sp. AK017]
MKLDFSLSLISLLKGVVTSFQKEAWENLIQFEPQVKRYYLPFGLDLYLDRSDGYAFLRQLDVEDEQLPRLAEKRQLNFFVSLLCLTLRKFLLEQDAIGGTVRAIVTRDEIVNRLKIFLPIANDEVKQQDKIVATINKVMDMGFLRKLDEQQESYEIHRIIRAYIDAAVIDDTLARLQAHATDKNITD